MRFQARPHYRSSRQGAVLLLAVYFVALALLIFGAVSLQRTNLEVHASQVSRDQQQAFWLSEAALEKGFRQMQREALLDLTLYPTPDPISTSFGNASFTLSTTRGQVTYDSPPPVFTQTLNRTITATGTSGPRAETISASVEEVGPLQGVWAKGLIVVNGGKEFGSSPIFAKGNLFSNLGSMITTIPAQSVSSSDPVEAKQANWLTFEGLTSAVNSEQLTTQVSQELLSLQAGYMFLYGIPSSPAPHTDADAVTWNVQESSTQASTHVQGVLGVNIVDAMDELPAAQCGRLELAEGQTLIVDDGFRQPGTHIIDSDSRSNFVRLCVSAMVPADDHGWAKVMTDDPPQVIFRQRTTLYVTGHQDFSLSDTSADVRVYLPACPTGGCLLPDVPGAWLPMLIPGMQTDWRATVGAKISTVDADGHLIPNGLQLIQHKEGKLASTKAGIIWIKPGQFSGSIYAPDSLVIFRARDSLDRGEDIQVPYIVGKEVVVELDADHLAIGSSQRDRFRPASTTLKSWIDP